MQAPTATEPAASAARRRRKARRCMECESIQSARHARIKPHATCGQMHAWTRSGKSGIVYGEYFPGSECTRSIRDAAHPVWQLHRTFTLSGSDPERPAYAPPSRLRCPCRAFNRRHATATPLNGPPPTRRLHPAHAAPPHSVRQIRACRGAASPTGVVHKSAPAQRQGAQTWPRKNSLICTDPSPRCCPTAATG